MNFEFDKRLDCEVLNGIYEGDLEHAQLIFEDFLQMAPAQMAEIEKEFLEKNPMGFKQKVHKIKPVFTYVGLSNLTRKAELLENQSASIFSIEEIREPYQAFKSEYDEFLPIIAFELNRLNSI